MLEQLRQYFHRQRSFDRHLEHEISIDASAQIVPLETRVSVDPTDPCTSPVSERELTDTHQLLSSRFDIVHLNEEQFSNTLTPLTLNQQLQLGHCYFEQGQFDEAIVHYRHALAIDPNQTEIYQYLAESLSKVGNLSEAAACYRKAIEISSAQSVELNPSQKHEDISSGNGVMKETMNGSRNGNGAVYVQKLESYLVEAENAYKQEDWQETVTHCLRTIQVQPGFSAYKLLGNALQRLERFSEAVEAYLSAIQLEPQSADIYANLGSLYAQQQRWQDAVIYYQKSIALKPDFAGVYRNLARVWSQLEQTDKASACWYRAFVLEPEQIAAEDWINLGNLLLQHHQMDEAIDCYHRAIDTTPTLAGGYQNLAEALVRQGKTEEAMPFYRQAQELGLNVASRELELSHELEPSHELERRDQAIVLSPETLRQLEPELAQTCHNLAESFHEKEKLIEVIRASKEALKQLEPELAQTCRNLAQSFHEKGRLAEAIRCYQQVVELKPDSAADRANLGNLYAQQAQWQTAVSCYQEAIALDANLASAHWHLAKVWEALHDSKQAAESFLRALTLEPDWASLPELLSLGHTLRSQGNEAAAIACYQQVIQRQVTCAEAHAALGEMFAHRQQWQDSITHYRQAILYCRNNLPYFVRLAQVFVAMQQWQKAVLVYRQVIGRDPQSSHYLALAQCLEQQELWNEAIEAYQTSVTLHPRWQVCHKLGDLLNRYQRWQEAVVAFRQAIDLNSEYSWSHNNLGDALIHLEQWQEAAEAFQKAVDLHPDFHWSHYNLGEALAKLEDWDGAIGAYRRALELQPALPYAQEKLGDALRKRSANDLKHASDCYHHAIQQTPTSIQCYHKALEVEPDNPELYSNLAKVLTDSGNLEGAIGFYKIALQINPNCSKTTEQLAKVLSTYDRINNAVAIYRRDIESIKPEDVKITFATIVLNEEEFIEKNLKQHYELCHEWILVEGVCLGYPLERVTEDGLSTDKTAKIIRNFPDPERKLRFIQHGWTKATGEDAKSELRNRYAELADTGILVVIDADEFYRRDDLRKVLQALAEEKWNCWRLPQLHFWKGTKQIITGQYWDVPHSRIYSWHKALRYRSNHNHPETECNKLWHSCGEFKRNSRSLLNLSEGYSHPDYCCFHFGFAKSEANMKDKTAYYINRGEEVTRPQTTISRRAWFEATIPDGCELLPWQGDLPEVFKETNHA